MNRYLETLFRHKEAFIVPFLATPLMALIVMLSMGKQYEVEALIWAQPSSVLDQLNQGRAVANQREAQAIREWLETEAFRREVMDQVGLTPAIQRGDWPVPTRLSLQLQQMGLTDAPGLRSVLKVAGLAPPATTEAAMDRGLDMIKKTLTVTTEGESLLRVTYNGKEPALGTRMVDEVINLYRDRVMEIRAHEAQVGVDFYLRQLQNQEQRLQQASDAYEQFQEANPPPLLGQVRPASEETRLDNLRRALLLEQTLYEQTLRRLEQLRMESEAAISTRDLSFQVVDPAQEPDVAGFAKRTIGMTLIFGLVLGTLLGLVPIILMTWMDGTVRSTGDIEQILDAPFVVQAPLIPFKGRRSEAVRGVLARGTAPVNSHNRRNGRVTVS